MRCILVLVLSLAVSNCARHTVRATAPDAAGVARSQPDKEAAAVQPPPDTLATFMAKVRKLSAEARPQKTQPQTVEGTDPQLKAALLEAVVLPTPDSYRAVAREYRRVGVFDKAHYYLTQALAVAPRDSDTFDALARLWRDSGSPNIALTEAYRAVFYAPSSPVTHNTLGTVLQALGQRVPARAAYERAVELDPGAAYALNNLCYGWLLEGQAMRAIDACQRALTLEPALAAARNNLGLAYTVAGNVTAAQQAFGGGGDRAAALYNTGIAYSARGQYADAVRAFAAAHAARPSMTVALARARQAAARLNAVSEE